MSAPAQPQPMSSSARQVSAASRTFVLVTTVLVCTAAASSFTLSYAAQAAFGREIIGLSGGLEYVLPAAVDLWIVGAVMVLQVLKARGQGEAPARTGWARFRLGAQGVQRASLLIWTIVSMALNTGHAFTTYRGDSAAGLIAVAATGILFPLGVAIACESVLHLAVSPVEAPAVARAKTTLVNARIPVASTTMVTRTPADQDLDAVIAAALMAPTASLRGVASTIGVSVHRVRSVRSRMTPAAA